MANTAKAKPEKPRNTANIGFEKQIWDAACVLYGHTSDMTHTPAETHTHKDGKIHYNIPAEVFKNNLTTAGDFQYDTDVSTTYGLTATLSAGESIFWKLSKTKTL